tara:strand:- start:20670 stop:21113 length:444 start_codon:yes stop_codon:yes gene_type:complete
MTGHLNSFQKAMTDSKHRDVAFALLKMFHPSIPEVYKGGHRDFPTISKMRISTKHDWVTISIVLKGEFNLNADIGVRFPCELYGGDKDLEEFEEQRRNNDFTAWRFVWDDGDTEDVPKKNMIHALMELNSIPKPTALEMSAYYHEDY